MVIRSKHNDWSCQVIPGDDELSALEVQLARLRSGAMWDYQGFRAEAIDELSRALTGSGTPPAWVKPEAYPEAL